MPKDTLIVHQEQPLNAEPPLEQLIAHPITPEELVYARNHCALSFVLDSSSVEVDGQVQSRR